MIGIISGHGAGCTIDFHQLLHEKITLKFKENYRDDVYPATLTMTSGIELISNDGVKINEAKITEELKTIDKFFPKDNISHITLLCNSLNANPQYKEHLEKNYNYLNICEGYNSSRETLILGSQITTVNKLYGDVDNYTYIPCDEIIFDCLLRRNMKENTARILKEYKNYENILLGCTELSYLYNNLKKERGGVHDSIDLLTTRILGVLK